MPSKLVSPSLQKVRMKFVGIVKIRDQVTSGFC